MNRTAWADGYMSDQPIGFVFARASLADVVFLAVEKLLRLRNCVRLPPSALEASKRDGNRIQHLKRKLASAGYYRDAPFDIRPIPDRLNKADVTSTLDRWADRLALYQEPQTQTPGRSRGLSPQARTMAWLRQFDKEEDVDCALKLIELFRMLDRSDTIEALKAFIHANELFRGAVVVPFGSARDSSAIQTYFSADLIGSYISGCTTLEQLAKGERTGPIISIDDFVGSGGQGQDILAAGFGVASLRKSLGEKRDLFDEPMQRCLRAAKLGFVFTSGWDTGVAAISDTAKELGLDARVYCHIKETAIPFAFENCLTHIDSDLRDTFRKRCEEIGTGIVIDMLEREGETDRNEIIRKAGERRLGYGNRAMLLASPFNVPTQTLTLFWGSGNVGGVRWEPLMLRRKKV